MPLVKQPLALVKERIYDKCDLLKEHAKMPQPDTTRMLQLINQIESLVEAVEDNPA